MIVTPLLLSLFAVDPAASLTSSAPAEPPEDAAMGDGLRFTEIPDGYEPRAVTCADGTTLTGVDISKWQGDVDWGDIANDGVKFAFVRVSDGLNSKDQKFDRNWEKARGAGIYTGVYQFFRPNQSVRGQADYLLEKMGCNMAAKTCPWSSLDLPPVIDVEYRPSGWSKTSMRNAIREWIDRVEEFGVEPVVYSGRYFWRDYVDSEEWKDHPFWIAHYTNACPNIPSHWSDWDFWQFTESGSVDGVNGNTDINRFNGTTEMLKALRPSDADVDPDPACGVIGSGSATIVDNTDDCFSLHGPDQYWRSTNAGHGGDMAWTRSTSGSEYNYGIWSLNFEDAGSYTLQAFVDESNTEATKAVYAIAHADGSRNVDVDQTDGGWIDLGRFDFDAGAVGHTVKLSDRTGVSGQKLAFDALRVVPEGVDVGDGDEEECDDDDHSPRTDSNDLRPAHDREGTLSCRAGGTAPSAWWLLLLLAPLRRRRRQ